MSLHRNRRLWQTHVLAENRRSIEGLLDTLCDDPVYTIMATGEEYRGKQAVTAFYTGLFDGVPDATFDLVNAFVGEAGVVEESVLRGTHQGVLFSIPPTGRAFALPLVIVFPMENGAILGERLYFDLGTLLRQLGLAQAGPKKLDAGHRYGYNSGQVLPVRRTMRYCMCLRRKL